jgi:hypothetical protein
VPILNPALRCVGIGYARIATATAWYVVMEVQSDPESDGEDSRNRSAPVCYPGDGQTQVFGRFGWGVEEIPDPLPAEAESTGYPITIPFSKRARITNGGARSIRTAQPLSLPIVQKRVERYFQ